MNAVVMWPRQNGKAVAASVLFLLRWWYAL
jgi:hypothetical protein